MTAIFPLLLTTIFGVFLTFLFKVSMSRYERWGLAYLLGIGLQTLSMFLLYLLGIRYTLPNFLIEIFFLILLLALIDWKIGQIDEIRKFVLQSINPKLILKDFAGKRLFGKMAILILAGFITVSFVIGVYLPVYGWDTLVLYDFRAITFVATGGMEDGIARGYFFGYPLLTSLAHTWVYFFKGSAHVVYWGIFVAFILVLYPTLAKVVSAKVAILTTVLAVMAPAVFVGSFYDYTNMPYLVYLVAGLMYLERYRRDRNPAFLFFSVLLTGLSTWVRSTEPFWVVNLLLIFMVMLPELKRKVLRTLFLTFLLAFIFFFIQQSWRLYETKMIGGGRNVADQLRYASTALTSKLDLARLSEVIEVTWGATVPTWYPFHYVALLAVIFGMKKIFKNYLLVVAVLFYMGLLFYGTYVFSLIWPEDWKGIIDSQQRMSSFLIPIFIIIAGIFTNDFIDEGVEIVEKNV